MANGDFKKVISELLDEGNGSRAAKSKRAANPAGALPTIDQRVDLYLRAVHGAKPVTAAQRAAARARILDAMAADLAGQSRDESEEIAAAVVPVRRTVQRPSAFAEALKRAGEALRDGLLFPLMGPSFAAQPVRLFALSCAAVLVIGGGWTATWFYAAHSAETAVASWIDSEAEAGRNYSCGSRKVGGFPTRVEISCTGFQATVAASDQSTLTVNATSVRAVASLFAPSTLTTDITGPVSVAQSQQATTYVGNFRVAQLTLKGPAANPQQVSLVLDDPEFYRVARGSQVALLAGGRLELDAKAADKAGGRVFNIAAHARDMSLPEGGLITSRPFVADVSAVLRDEGGRTASNLAARLRDWQQAGGRLEVAQAQLEQGDAIATGSGEIALNNNGQLQGSLRVSTGGAYAQLAQSYLRDGQGGARERERVAQAYLGTPRVNRSLGGPQTDKALAPRRPALREPSQAAPAPQGKYEIPIRFNNGAIYFGTTPLAETPPLF